jgi:hypothetical protein
VSVERRELVIRHEGHEVERVHADLDTDDGEQLRGHLLAGVKRNGDRERDIGEYLLDVYKPGRGTPEFTYSAI